MIKLFSYNFADYLELLNERFKSISSIFMGLHNEQVCNRNAVHDAESLTLRDFLKGRHCILSFSFKNSYSSIRSAE